MGMRTELRKAVRAGAQGGGLQPQLHGRPNTTERTVLLQQPCGGRRRMVNGGTERAHSSQSLCSSWSLCECLKDQGQSDELPGPRLRSARQSGRGRRGTQVVTRA